MPAHSSLQNLVSHAAARRIMAAAARGQGEARLVGGAVRDALLGRGGGDIDMATTLPPPQMAACLEADGVKTVPTGIDFGTITAVIEGKGYEITTLRHDVETDGRRAKVAFTDDWQADAARRDFTMNALYLDSAGKLYDYFGGREDAEAGRVRFIGAADERIREDVLRILRFFRFFAWFGKNQIDADGLAACSTLANLIPQLSAERVWKEILKLLAAPDPLPAWRMMAEAGVAAQTLPEAANIARLAALLQIETTHAIDAAPLRRLAALLPDDEKTAETVARRMKVSKREAVRILSLAALPRLLRGNLDAVPFRRALYEFGVENAADAALLAAAAHPADIKNVQAALTAAAAWDNPQFPLQGHDLQKLGMAPGPAMGQLLKALEEEWIDSDFKKTREQCLATAKKKLSTDM